MDRKNLAYTGGAETRAKPGAKPKAKRPKRGVDAIDPSRRPPEIIDGRVRGNAKHELVGGLLSDGIRHPSWKEIVRRATALDLLDNPAIKYRQAMLAHVCVGTALYFRFFLPHDGWEFVGTEVALDGCRYDLLWKDEQGRYVADELKTGRLAVGAVESLEEQLSRELQAGVKAYGEAFRGIRVLFPAAVRDSFFATPDGRRELLAWVGDEPSEAA